MCDHSEDGGLKDKAGSGDVEEHREDHARHEGHWTLSRSKGGQEPSFT